MRDSPRPNKEPAVQITLRIPASLRDELRELADMDQRSTNKKAQLLLEEACERERARLQEEPVKETA
ncbi:MAG: hypothetical protein ACLFRB_06740 [Thiohalorhabdus sp.]|uniref:hypothetical protein n=1 Tax=Thiohalorhabdus sp. TaxID=3094134 RepID=UPI00397F2CCF